MVSSIAQVESVDCPHCKQATPKNIQRTSKATRNTRGRLVYSACIRCQHCKRLWWETCEVSEAANG